MVARERSDREGEARGDTPRTTADCVAATTAMRKQSIPVDPLVAPHDH
ncbi:hypothetical protein HMPREF0063_12489 [Aeromicrobium marinum DSM 15272]|uniref:Uncharacterized protein n=1 Tax=Aeromicrobium marinum DSM 15272 TaxID=585531 RepID=E2SEN0_9ACTN|nr:hypothetical protein HMPREF0063_12489 [Aeromicrobium marinum DSM 15272]